MLCCVAPIVFRMIHAFAKKECRKVFLKIRCLIKHCGSKSGIRTHTRAHTEAHTHIHTHIYKRIATT